MGGDGQMALVGLQTAVLPALFPSWSHNHNSIQQGLWPLSLDSVGVTSPAYWFSPGPFLPEANSIKATCQRPQCLIWSTGGGVQGAYCLKSLGHS